MPEEPASPLGLDDITGADDGTIGVLDDITGGVCVIVGPALGLEVVAGGGAEVEADVVFAASPVAEVTGLSFPENPGRSAPQPASKDKVEVNVVRTVSGRKGVPRFMRAPENACVPLACAS